MLEAVPNKEVTYLAMLEAVHNKEVTYLAVLEAVHNKEVTYLAMLETVHNKEVTYLAVVFKVVAAATTDEARSVHVNLHLQLQTTKSRGKIAP